MSKKVTIKLGFYEIVNARDEAYAIAFANATCALDKTYDFIKALFQSSRKHTKKSSTGYKFESDKREAGTYQMFVDRYESFPSFTCDRPSGFNVEYRKRLVQKIEIRSSVTPSGMISVDFSIRDVAGQKSAEEVSQPGYLYPLSVKMQIDAAKLTRNEIVSQVLSVLEADPVIKSQIAIFCEKIRNRTFAPS